MRRWWLNALILATAIALGLYAHNKPSKDDVPTYAISALTPAQISKARIERGANVIELEKKGNVWGLVSPFVARADSSQVTRMLDVLSAKSREKLAATDPGRFDLDKPRLTLRLADQSIAFGTSNPLTQDQYVLSGGSVYLIPSFYGMQIPEKPDRFLTHALFSETEKPTGFELPNLHAQLSDGKWTVTRPSANEAASKETLSQDDLNRWLDDWRFSSSLLTQPYDLRPGLEQIRVHLADGKTLTLDVLQKSPDLILARRDEMLQFQYSSEAGKRMLDPKPEPLPDASKPKGPGEAK